MNISEMNSDELLWVYNAHDVMLPLEILPQVQSRMNARHRAIYGFERACQAVAWSMMVTGVKVDQILLKKETRRCEAEIEDLKGYVRSLVLAVWGDGINVNSPEQMKQLFYHDPSGFRFKPKHTGAGQKRRETTERKALEDLAAENYICRPVVRAILALKDVGKQLEFLKRGVEDDGRVHCTFNVAATESGRWSSSKNPWGRGANFQNQDENTRSIYIADVDEVFGYPDLEQAESRGVAYLSGDEAYIRAVLSGDLHTQVAKLLWPELDWPNDNGPEDRALAETPFYRHFTRRDMSKRGGHALNYFGTPWTIAKNLNVEIEVAEEFSERYFGKFSGIPLWHAEVQRLLQDTGVITTPLGRERMFFGRLSDRETLKEAIAYVPQSTISDILKLGCLRVWKHFQLKRRTTKLLADLHDGTLISLREDSLDETVPKLKSLMEIPVQMPHGVMTIPVEFSVGYKWQKKEMKKWKPGILSELTRPTREADLLDTPANLV